MALPDRHASANGVACHHDHAAHERLPRARIASRWSLPAVLNGDRQQHPRSRGYRRGWGLRRDGANRDVSAIGGWGARPRRDELSGRPSAGGNDKRGCNSDDQAGTGVAHHSQSIPLVPSQREVAGSCQRSRMTPDRRTSRHCLCAAFLAAPRTAASEGTLTSAIRFPASSSARTVT